MGRSGVKSHTDGSNVKKKEARSKYDLASLRKARSQTVTWAPALFRVAGGSRTCGHCLLVLRASAQSQSSGQQGHNHHHFYKFQFISPPFAASCSACLGKGSHRSNVFLRPFGCIAPRDLHPDRAWTITAQLSSRIIPQ